MSEDLADYGPLKCLIGEWIGSKGLDVAPEPNGTENNPYYETIIYTAIGELKNAEVQAIAALHYRQIVKRKSNDEVFHDETGYWMWDAKEQTVMHSLAIPRAVCVLAGGKYVAPQSKSSTVTLEVSASLDDQKWQIIQSPFMSAKAKTTKFFQKIEVKKDVMTYHETTMVDIYGKSFEHTDTNVLKKQKA